MTGNLQRRRKEWRGRAGVQSFGEVKNYRELVLVVQPEFAEWSLLKIGSYTPRLADWRPGPQLQVSAGTVNCFGSLEFSQAGS